VIKDHKLNFGLTVGTKMEALSSLRDLVLFHQLILVGCEALLKLLKGCLGISWFLKLVGVLPNLLKENLLRHQYEIFFVLKRMAKTEDKVGHLQICFIIRIIVELDHVV